MVFVWVADPLWISLINDTLYTMPNKFSQEMRHVILAAYLNDAKLIYLLMIFFVEMGFTTLGQKSS
jgi:hypothetical protein